MDTQHIAIPEIAHRPGFSPDSKLWVYTASRPLSEAESSWMQAQLDAFCAQWTAHNQALKAAAQVFEHQFVFLMADETQTGASGCSIDKSVHFLEQLGAAIGADLFERMRFAWIAPDGSLQFANRPDFSARVRAGEISDSTLVADTLVQTKRQLAEGWLKPLAESWHRRLV